MSRCCRIYVFGLDGVVSEISAFAEVVVLLVAHSHPDVDGVAIPGGGQHKGGLALLAVAGVAVVDSLSLGRVVDEDHRLVGSQRLADAAVVGPRDVDGLAVNQRRRAVGQVEVALRHFELIVEKFEVGEGAADGVLVVGLEAGGTGGHSAGLEGFLDESRDTTDEFVQHSELEPNSLLFLSFGVVRCLGFTKNTLVVFTILEVADGGAELTREGVH